MNGERNLWLAVLSQALRDLDEGVGVTGEKDPAVIQEIREEAREWFFGEGEGDLEMVCELIGVHVDDVRKVALERLGRGKNGLYLE